MLIVSFLLICSLLFNLVLLALVWGSRVTMYRMVDAKVERELKRRETVSTQEDDL